MKKRNVKRRVNAVTFRIIDTIRAFCTDTDSFSGKVPESARISATTRAVAQSIRDSEAAISRELSLLKADAEWSAVTIAFYGETNAGKSTLLEGLIKGNGNSIGNGSKDYTKETASYRGAYGCKLLDTPGIEGHEQPVVHEIEQAIRRSHVVMYIYSSKHPESGTVRKLRRNLRNNARIYAIQNARGRSSRYRYSPKLETPAIQQVAAETESILQREFGRQFAGGMTVNGLMGFLGRASTLPPRFMTEFDKAIDLFGSAAAAYRFSHFNDLVREVASIARNGPRIICITNIQKLTAVLRRVSEDLVSHKAAFDSVLGQFAAERENIVEKAQSRYEGFKRMAIREVDTRFAELRSELKRVVDDGIREGKTEKTVIASVKAVLKKLNRRLATRLNSEVELLADEIDELGEGLKDRILMYFQVSAPSGKDDLDGLGEAIKTDWSDIARQIRQILFDVAEAILAFFMGKVVGLIVAVVKAAKWIWRLFSRNRQTRQREARQRAHKKVDELVNKAYSQVKERLNRQLRRLKSKINRTLDQSAGIMVDYGNFGTTVARHVMALAVAQGQLCTIAAEVASNEAAKCCYFDVDQQRATVIGNVGSVDLRQELGMSEVETWPSLKKWLKAKGHKMSDSTLRLVSPDDYERQCARAFAPRMRVTTIEVCDQ